MGAVVMAAVVVEETAMDEETATETATETAMDEETATEMDTETEDMVTVVVTATAALTVVMVTGTVVVMATVAAAVIEEDVATERSPGMVVNGHFKRGTVYDISIRTS